MAGRRAARRTALFLLYQWDVTGQPLASLYEGEVDEFARDLAAEVVARSGDLDALISELSDSWPASRLGALERNVLRIGLHELERGDVPAEVAVNEAVELAKRYASEDAARLVNGILGRAARDRPAREPEAEADANSCVVCGRAADFKVAGHRLCGEHAEVARTCLVRAQPLPWVQA